jgi:hypothetical protein
MKDELEIEPMAIAEETQPTSFSFRNLDEETLQILMDDKIATGG